MSNTWECPLCFGIGEHRDRCAAAHLKVAPAAPTIHMNGTGFKDLYEDMEVAGQAIDAAMKQLQRAAPNGRDYYVQATRAGFSEMERAQSEHWSRLKRLASVKAEVELILMAISDQEPKRGNR
jgi:hypothetical protein